MQSDLDAMQVESLGSLLDLMADGNLLSRGLCGLDGEILEFLIHLPILQMRRWHS